MPSFTVAQNIVMSREPRRLGVLFDNKAAEAAAQRLVEEYGLVVDPAAVVREIGVGLQQRVEILKTLYRGADILILDEPTAVLTPQETDELFAVIRRVVRELGMTVIIITHKLYEVMAISDRVGVMRKGRLIGVENTCDVDEKKLASMMVGRPVLYDRLEKTGEAGAEQIRVSGLTVCDDRGLVAVDGLSLSVRAGEVLGIAAIEGNGQSELLEAITGMRRVERGTVEVCGQNVTGKTAGEIRKVGLSHIPEDRLATGVSRSASVTDNLLMGKQRDKAFSGFAFHQRRSSIERYAEEVYERFDIRGAGIDTAVGSMSGGNMQKVVVAREFSFDSPVLIIAQPTRGVDVGAIEFIHTRIIEKRNAGCAILLCSADLDEVFRLSDRIFIQSPNIADILVADGNIVIRERNITNVNIELWPARGELGQRVELVKGIRILRSANHGNNILAIVLSGNIPLGHILARVAAERAAGDGRAYLASVFGITIILSGRSNANITQAQDLISPTAGCIGSESSIAGNLDVHGLSNLAKIIDRNCAALTIGAVERAAGDIQVQGVAVGCIITGIRAAKHIESIRKPSIAGNRIETCRAVDVIFRGIDRTTADVDLTHAEGNAAIERAAGDD